jgi:hypothetical protein
MELTVEDIEVLKDVFDGYGNDCPGGNTDKIQALAEKLGIWKPIEPPTEEELKRREEFRNSPLGKQISELFSQSNEYLIAALENHKLDVLYSKGTQWPVGTELNISIPDDI